MALSNILQTIEEDTQKQIEELKKEGEQRKTELRKELNAETEKKKKELLAKFDQRASKKIAQASWEFSSRTQTAVLKKKQAVLDSVFDKALKNLADLPEKQYVDVVASMFKSLPKMEKGAEVLSAKGKESATKNSAEKAGVSITFSKDTLDSTGGFIVKGKEVNIDMTFEALLRAYRSDHETDIASKLFA
ncbi:MAG: V-type ATP synthase subunit E [Candidatus Kerfeldbacteria bacterium]